MSQATLPKRPYVNSGLFSSHYLDERLLDRDEWDCDESAKEAMEDLQALYETERYLVDGKGEDALIDDWIDEILDVLGFGTRKEVTLPDGGGFVDELLFESPTDRRDAEKVALDTGDTTDLFECALGIVEAKQWDADFTERFSEQRPYYNASQQIKRYLGKTPEVIQWGILTNGRKWRLYGTKEYEEQIYYEIDLPELLEEGEVEAFKYFYVFFRPEALRESAGTTFLDEVWSESETASQELGEDLQDNVFTALRVLGRGFVESNDSLDIDPDDDEALDELKDQSLVLLYRLMFVLYAESRNLIHPDNPAAVDEYEENFSLDELRLDIHGEIGEVDEGFEDEFSGYSTTMWSRLEDLFRLIDEGKESLGIPPYNGGLFNTDEHTFLTENDVSNRYLAEVIYRLSTTHNDEGRYVLADYGDLDTRHLGSVYEGLLEHQFRIASEEMAAVSEDGGQVWKPATEVSVAEAVETVPEGGLYVVNDEGERKATGAYYTPDYVVTYIVEETVDPLVEEIRDDLIEQGFEPETQEYLGPFLRRITDLKILDPAMGSGHFLTKATGYLAQQVMEEVREVEAEMGVAFDEQHIRREIAKECIYGVDLNGMAVELAKLSMWLETLAAERPLAFLDHHLKEGNSLIGSDIESIEELESDANGDDEQYSLAEFGATREGTIERLMDIYSEFLTIENETVEDVREMKRKYTEIEQDELRKRLVSMANVHTAERFDVSIPSGAYERMAKALEDDVEWEEVAETDWFKSAQALAEQWSFYHWELEFPDVFYNENGKRKEDDGFDAVIGNPPYVRPHNLRDTFKEYLWKAYEQSYQGKSDLLNCFLHLSVRKGGEGSNIGMITSDTWRVLSSAEGLRNYLLEECRINKWGLLPKNVFQDASVETVCIFLSPEEDAELREDNQITISDVQGSKDLYNISQSEYEKKGSVFYILTEEQNELRNRIALESTELGEIAEVDFGLKTGDDSKYLKEESDQPEDEKLISSHEVAPYYASWTGQYVWYVPQDMKDHRDTARPGTRERFEREKIIVSRMSERPSSVVDRSGVFVKDALLVHLNEHYSHEYICALINSKLIDFYYSSVYTTVDLHRNELMRFPIRVISTPIEPNEDVVDRVVDHLPEYLSGDTELSEVIENFSGLTTEITQKTQYQVLNNLVPERESLTEQYHQYNLNLLDYLGEYSDGQTLSEIGIAQASPEAANSILQKKLEQQPYLKTEKAQVVRKSESTVDIRISAKYKPDNPEDYETDRNDYTQTEYLSALRITDLREVEADLIEEFVPVAVEKAGSFAEFHEGVTKTNSLIDRMRKLTLPAVEEVRVGLESYIKTKERAEELEDKIQRTDDLIDEIVYELYGLTDEEIEIVEDAVGDD